MDSTTPFQPWTAKDGSKSDRDLVDDAKHHREDVNHPKHTQTASYDKESALTPSGVPGPSSASGTGLDPSKSKAAKMDSSKIASMQQIVENTLSPEAFQRVNHLLEAVEALSGPEKLLLYLRLPTGLPSHDPLKQPLNPLGSRAELQQTITWIQTHLEVDPDVSLPKQDVYDEYIAHCMSSNMKALSTADFGKVMKQVYPTVRPRRLGTRGHSRYCYAGLRKKIKLEVPQLPDLGESSSKELQPANREAERIVCDWAENKLGIKFGSLSELSRHLVSAAASVAALPSPPPLTPRPPHAPPTEDPAGRQLMKQLKRKIQQTHGTPGRPKKYKAPEVPEELPSTSYGVGHLRVKHEGSPGAGGAVSAAGSVGGGGPAPPGPAGYPYEEMYAGGYDVRYGYRQPEVFPRELPPAHALPPHLPMNLSSDASLDLSTERRRAPERLPLPGKKLILEAYQNAQPPPEPRPPDPRPAQYLPKKMRAAEILGGKLAARHSLDASPSSRPEDTFLEDPKNVANRSTSTAAALARDQVQAASPAAGSAGDDLICQEKHSEIMTRERVISICNIDKHDLDDYLNEAEGNSQENDEELLHYFPRRHPDHTPTGFLGASLDPQDEHSQGKNEKISQLRELLAKNLKNQSGSSFQSLPVSQDDEQRVKESVKNHNSTSTISDETVKRNEKKNNIIEKIANGSTNLPNPAMNTKHMNTIADSNNVPNNSERSTASLINSSVPSLYNGNCHTVPQSPTTRTQQYDFVPISDGVHSPGNFNSKSPLGFGQRGLSPSKSNQKPVLLSGSLQTSPISHSTAASPFVSPRNTPVPRSRLCSRPIPKHKKRNPLTIGVNDTCPKQFAIPNEQKFLPKSQMCLPGIKYCMAMSAPPSPNIVCTQYKNHTFQSGSASSNGHGYMSLNFLSASSFRDSMNGDLTQPLSADPLSSEVSQFFQDPHITYRAEHDTTFRSQSVPLKQAINAGLYNKTPVGSVPPTPVPNEFCDFGSLADTCDISKAGLNPETLDKIYDAIDSSNEVLNPGAPQNMINSSETLTNGCELMPEPQILGEELNSLLPSDDILDRNAQFDQSIADDAATADNVEDFLKRTNSLELNLADLDTDKNKYYISRSVPSTPVPQKRTVPNLQIDPRRRARELFASDLYLGNGVTSKSVPSTPQMVEEKVFSYSNRDFLINGNSVETSLAGGGDTGLASPLHDMLREDIMVLDTLAPTADLLADLDKIEPPYVDL